MGFRDLDRERAKLEGQEKKIIADIKKMAKLGQMVHIFCSLLTPPICITKTQICLTDTLKVVHIQITVI